MATLTSAGVSVSVTNESFYIPASSPTVPLFVVATAEDKKDGEGAILPGVQEANTVRTITSLGQSLEMFGAPRFLMRNNGTAMHGDARNEYGLLALNQFLSQGNRAYVVRASVNLNDDFADVQSLFMDKVAAASLEIQAEIQAYIDHYNVANNASKTTIDATALINIIEANKTLFSGSNFDSQAFFDDFTTDHNLLEASLNVYDDAPYFTQTSASFDGLAGEAAAWADGVDVPNEWTAAEAGTFLTDIADDFSNTKEFWDHAKLGNSDATRRTAIVAALNEALNSEVLRAESLEFNIVATPGYHEAVTNMAALATDVGSEAFVVADTPMDVNPDDVVTWAESVDRVQNELVGYYYGHGLTTNVDGSTVFGAASGIAIRTIAASDNATNAVWFAPAGVQRGVVTGVQNVGYLDMRTSATGDVVSTFVEAALNQGQRDNLYKDGTNINPITFMPGRGIVIMGQKTSAPAASATDRINVVRMLAHIRRALRKNTFAFVFEPNDQLTRDNLKAMVDNFLSDLVVRRGLYDYATLCDESNNTAARIDRNELWIDVAIKPTKAAEFVYIPIRVLSTGADL